MTEVGDALMGCIDKLDNGWCKGKLRDADGRYCAVGALVYGVWYDSSATYEAARSAVFDALPEEFKTGNAWAGVLNSNSSHEGRIVGFNNHPDTTYEMVREVFEKAAMNQGVTP